MQTRTVEKKSSISEYVGYLHRDGDVVATIVQQQPLPHAANYPLSCHRFTYQSANARFNH
jgi:hypothetical protein